MARVALENYGLSEAKLTFLNDEGSVILRVDKPMPLSPESAAYSSMQDTLLATAFTRHNSTMQFEHKKWRDESEDQLLKFFNSRRANILRSGD